MGIWNEGIPLFLRVLDFSGILDPVILPTSSMIIMSGLFTYDVIKGPGSSWLILNSGQINDQSSENLA